MKLTKAQVTAAEIIDLLSERKGFDGWWDDVSRENQQDIVGRIVEILETNEYRDQN